LFVFEGLDRHRNSALVRRTWLAGALTAGLTLAVPTYGFQLLTAKVAEIGGGQEYRPQLADVMNRVAPEDALRRLQSLHDFRLGSPGSHTVFGQTAISGLDIDGDVLVYITAGGARKTIMSLRDIHPVADLPFAYLAPGSWYLWGASTRFMTAGAYRALVDDLLAVTQLSFARAEKAEQVAFESALPGYRDAAVKPVPGEDVRRFVVQAEAAVNDKRFQDAANLYMEALHLAPWWPDGQLNAALIFGSLNQYSAAITHMKRYLALKPDASDARQAQDQIYVWEGARAAIVRDAESSAPANPAEPRRGK
jgi:tetratricopeptide (TPR) repeat protein